MGEEQIKYMRDRFLTWTLPRNLNPDGGISFQRSESAVKYNHPWPVGTNFLDATQAEEMVRHMTSELPKSIEINYELAAVEMRKVIERLIAANAKLGTIGADGKTLYEESPTKSEECYRAWVELNNAIAEAKVWATSVLSTTAREPK